MVRDLFGSLTLLLRLLQVHPGMPSVNTFRVFPLEHMTIPLSGSDYCDGLCP